MAGEWDVSKIERGLTAKKFIGWEAFAAIEPFGELRQDIRAASIRQMIFNMAVAVKDRKPLQDFMLKFDESGEKRAGQTWQEKKAIGLAIAMAYSQPKTKTGAVDSGAKAAAMADALLKAHNAKGA